MILIGSPCGFVSLLQFLHYFWIACHCEKSWQPVMMLNNSIGNRTSFDLARPAHKQRDTECSFRVGILFTAEWCSSSIWPGVAVRPVISGIHDKGIFGNSKLIFFFFNDTDTTEIYTLSLHDALPI